MKFDKAVWEDAQMKRFDRARRAKASTPRVWPAIVLLICLLVLHWLPALFAEQTMATRMTLFLGPQAIVLLILVWWLFMSRIPLRERLLGMGGIALILAGTMALSDASLTEGFGIIGSVVPWGMAAFAIGFIASHWLPDWRRTGQTQGQTQVGRCQTAGAQERGVRIGPG